MTPFVPVMNGVGGNLSAIQASRLSTALHSVHGRPGFVRQVPLHRNSDSGPRGNGAGPATDGTISFAAAAAANSSASAAGNAASGAADGEVFGNERFRRANEHSSEPSLPDGGILLPPGSCPLPNPVDTFFHPFCTFY